MCIMYKRSLVHWNIQEWKSDYWHTEIAKLWEACKREKKYLFSSLEIDASILWTSDKMKLWSAGSKTQKLQLFSPFLHYRRKQCSLLQETSNPSFQSPWCKNFPSAAYIRFIWQLQYLEIPQTNYINFPPNVHHSFLRSPAFPRPSLYLSKPLRFPASCSPSDPTTHSQFPPSHHLLGKRLIWDPGTDCPAATQAGKKASAHPTDFPTAEELLGSLPST